MTSISPVRSEPARLRQTSIKEYGIRFLFGGLVTAVVGVLASIWGPEVAGLFLAFPAVLIASLTLIADHEDRAAAGADALGAAAGSIGLAAFGAVIWILSTRSPAVWVLGMASIVWLVVSLAAWAGGDAWRRRGRSREERDRSS